MHVKQSACQTRRMIFVASFEWVRANKILPVPTAEKRPLQQLLLKR